MWDTWCCPDQFPCYHWLCLLWEHLKILPGESHLRTFRLILKHQHLMLYQTRHNQASVYTSIVNFLMKHRDNTVMICSLIIKKLGRHQLHSPSKSDEQLTNPWVLNLRSQHFLQFLDNIALELLSAESRCLRDFFPRVSQRQSWLCLIYHTWPIE